MDVDERLDHALRAHGDVATRQMLVAAGVPPGVLRGAERRGEVARLGPGVWGRGDLDRNHPDVRRRVALAAMGPDSLLCGATAAAVWGLRRSRAGEAVHVAVPHGRHRRKVPGVRVHQMVRWEPSRWGGWPVTAVRETLIGLAGAHPDKLRFPALAAVQRGLIAPTDLAGVAGVPTHFRGVWRAVAEEAAAGAESGAEALYWRALAAAGIPLPRLNAAYEVGGTVFRIDALWEGLRLGAEIDGREHHTREADFESDRVRQNLLLTSGLVLIRFSASQVMTDRAGAVSSTAAALRARAAELEAPRRSRSVRVLRGGSAGGDGSGGDSGGGCGGRLR